MFIVPATALSQGGTPGFLEPFTNSNFLIRQAIISSVLSQILVNLLKLCKCYSLDLGVGFLQSSHNIHIIC